MRLRLCYKRNANENNQRNKHRAECTRKSERRDFEDKSHRHHADFTDNDRSDGSFVGCFLPVQTADNGRNKDGNSAVRKYQQISEGCWASKCKNNRCLTDNQNTDLCDVVERVFIGLFVHEFFVDIGRDHRRSCVQLRISGGHGCCESSADD